MYVFRISSHIYNSFISLQLVSFFASSFRLSPDILTVYVRPIFIPMNPVPPIDLLSPQFSLFSPIPRNETIELDARNCFERGWRQREFDRISYQAIYRENMLLTFTCSIFHLVSCRLHIEQVSRLNMILNKFPCRYL